MYKDIKITPILESIKLLDISDEEYFSIKYRDYISNSKLKYINPDEGGSPELFNSPMPFSISDSFYIGSCIHELFLQPEEFELIETVDRPTAKAGFMADELYYPYKNNNTLTKDDYITASNKVNYYKNTLNADKISALEDKILPYFKQRLEYDKSPSSKEPIFLDPKSRAKVKQCLTNLNTEEVLNVIRPEGLFDKPESYNEAVILLDVICSLKDKEVTLKLKAKLDNFVIDNESNVITLNDLKTSGHYVSQFKEKSFIKYHYYRQCGMYGWMLSLLNKQLFKLHNPKFLTNIIIVSTIPDHDTLVMPITSKMINKGVKEFSNLLKRVAYMKLNE